MLTAREKGEKSDVEDFVMSEVETMEDQRRRSIHKRVEGAITTIRDNHDVLGDFRIRERFRVRVRY